MSSAKGSARPSLGFIGLTGLCFVYWAVYLVPNILPLVSGLLIDGRGMSPQAAGWALSGYLGAMTLAAFLTGAVEARLSRRRIAILAICAQCAGFALCVALFRSPLGFGGGFIAAGLGNGAMFAVVNAVIAAQRRPIFIYGLATVVACLAAVPLPAACLFASAHLGPAGVFILLAIVSPLLFATLPIFPGRSAATNAKAWTAIRQMFGSSRRQRLLAGVFLTNVAQMVFYAFADTLLSRLGYSSTALARIFTVVMFTAAIGGAIACLLTASRRPLSLHLVLITLALGAVVALSAYTRSGPLATLGVWTVAALALLVVDVQLAVAAELDPSGDLAAMATGALFLSWTVSPVLGGWLIERLGFTGLGLTALAICCVAAALHVEQGAPGGRDAKQPFR